MIENVNEAKSVLDQFLFYNIHNAYLPGKLEDDWKVTYEGDNYVVRHIDWNDGNHVDYHFRVTIEPHVWDSTQAIADQEWDE